MYTVETDFLNKAQRDVVYRLTLRALLWYLTAVIVSVLAD